MMNERALVISGGGSKGAYAGGVAQKLNLLGKKWDRFYGTSTGSLLNLLISQNKFAQLRHLYTNVSNRDIFNKPPFNQEGKLNIIRAFWRTLIGKTSIGEAKLLFELIKENLTPHDFFNLKNKIVCNCVVNYSRGAIQYGYNLGSYDDFIRYAYASSSVPLAMDLVKIGNEYYLDGGVMEHIPIQRAIDDGATEIDAIVLRPNYSEHDKVDWKPSNVLNVSMRTIELMLKSISTSDVIVGKLASKNQKHVNLNLYYINEITPLNSLVFNPDVMNKWWDEGYDSITESNLLKTKTDEVNLPHFKVQKYNLEI